MDKLLSDQIVSQLRDMFGQLKEPVQILFFGAQEDCEYCDDTHQLLEEVAAVDERISLSVFDLAVNADIAQQFHVDKAPTIVIAARDADQIIDFGIQYAGIPSGHEFSTLVNDIVLVSGRDSGLSQPVRDYLKTLEKPLHMQVFVTPSCPYCPRAVVLAHQMAMENPTMIRAEGVEATEFPDLSARFRVNGVPQTTINAGAGTIVGAVPETQLFAEIQRALTLSQT